LRREVETDLFHKQRKRGTTVEEKHQKSNISMSIQKPAGNKSSTTNNLAAPSKNDTIDTHAKTTIQHDKHQTIHSAKDDQSVLGQTLMARVANMNRTMPTLAVGNGKKDMGQTANSSVNLASKATATSMSGTQNKTLMSSAQMGMTSPFRDTT